MLVDLVMVVVGKRREDDAEDVDRGHGGTLEAVLKVHVHTIGTFNGLHGDLQWLGEEREKVHACLGLEFRHEQSVDLAELELAEGCEAEVVIELPVFQRHAIRWHPRLLLSP
ncbi:hypothetical protein H257_00045 [Aphanomyces astaci]|uniref:Uncharacterized protein n=1 Tax=Aphanomyces astaci TaxID=112090 RepID=W4H8Q9_APHAT|nr:hypothetical protein H257_00045 [Aphanomyces astaci]ETV88430.1 hypothetical protein H257_00045 [Aphanomyces astaci]|eukprot:XP_009820830.1 hypothetical protein H257_00045 [Aphanomyces astaci]